MQLTRIFQHPLLKSSVIYTITDAINKSVPFLILPVLSYYLLPSDYGIVANFGVLYSIISIFVIAGVDGAVTVSYFKLSKEELSKYIFNCIVIIVSLSFLLFFLVLIFNDLIYSFVKIPLEFQLLSVSMALAGAFTGINLSLWRLEERAMRFGIYKFSQTIVDLGISLVLVTIYRLGWVGRINGMILATVIFGLISLFLIHRRGYLEFSPNSKLIVSILAFGLPLIPHSLSFWLRSGVDRILLTKFVGEYATGLYATGFQFGILVSFITLSFNNAFVPYMYKLLNEEDELILERNKSLLRKVILSGFCALIVMCIIFTLISDIFLDVFFAETYLAASQFIFWAILSQTFQGMYLFFVNYIFFAKKTKNLAIITFFCAFLQVILSYFCIIYYGAIGAAYATVVISFINFLIVAWYSNRVYPMNWRSVW